MLGRASFRAFATKTSQTRLSVSWLDLRGSGLSILERLLLEECLLQHDPQNRNWVIAGQHSATPQRYLQEVTLPKYVNDARGSEMYNPSTAIVLGIGGKPAELLNIPLVKEEGCLCLKRFSGGGTVVLDPDSIWTTLIFRNSNAVPADPLPEAFPRPIMEWTADRIFGKLFASLKEKQMLEPMANEKSTLVMESKSCCGLGTSGKVMTMPVTPSAETKGPFIPPDFELRENDYILGDRKMGGNAQTIVKSGWLHHTSFLWDYQPENMEYLTLPKKRPDYRKDRAHSSFLAKLNEAYPSLSKQDFVATLGDVCGSEFEVERVTFPEAMQVLEEKGGMQGWFEKGARTRIVSDLPDATE
jgi:lipoate-protein ligase A